MPQRKCLNKVYNDWEWESGEWLLEVGYNLVRERVGNEGKRMKDMGRAWFDGGRLL
jgi:hypothetical protein